MKQSLFSLLWLESNELTNKFPLSQLKYIDLQFDLLLNADESTAVIPAPWTGDSIRAVWQVLTRHSSRLYISFILTIMRINCKKSVLLCWVDLMNGQAITINHRQAQLYRLLRVRIFTLPTYYKKQQKKWILWQIVSFTCASIPLIVGLSWRCGDNDCSDGMVVRLASGCRPFFCLPSCLDCRQNKRQKEPLSPKWN